MRMNTIFNNSSEDIQNIIICFGTNMFKKLRFDILSDEDIKQEFSKYNDNSNIQDILQASFDNEKKFFLSNEKRLQIQIDTSQETINILQNKINKLYEENETIIQNEKEKLQELFTIKEESKNREMDSLRKEINLQNMIEEKFLEKKSFSHSTAQGDYVEKMFDEIVNKGLPYDDKASIEDTSNIGGSGDRLIIFSNGFRLLIEVKNKGSIQKDDIVDFQRHYMKDFEENKIDNALFFSFRTPQIPSICKALCPQYKENNKVIYYGLEDTSTVDEKKARISSCIEEIYRRHVNETENDVKEELCNPSNIYEMYLETLKNNELSITNKIKTNEKDKDDFQKELTHIKKRINELHLEIQQNNITVRSDLLDDGIYKECLLLRISTWGQKNNIIFHKTKWREQIRNGIPLTTYDEKILSKKIKQGDLQKK
jgi:hypothetical protein